MFAASPLSMQHSGVREETGSLYESVNNEPLMKTLIVTSSRQYEFYKFLCFKQTKGYEWYIMVWV